MAKIIKSRDLGKVHRAKVYLAPDTCHDVDESSVDSRICETEIINQSYLNTRFYDIMVTARDEIGNEGNATCSVIVIPKHHLSGNQCLHSAKASKGTGHSAKASKGTGLRRLSAKAAKETAQSVSVAKGTEHIRSTSTVLWENSPFSGSDKGTGLSLSANVAKETAQSVSVASNNSRKSSKSSKASVPHDPNDLREVFVSSVQRFQVAQMELEWDTSLDTSRS